VTDLPLLRPFSALAALALLAVPASHADTLDAAALDQARQMAVQAATLAASNSRAGHGPQQPPRPGAAPPRVEVVAGALDPRLRLAPCRHVDAYLPAGARAWGRTRIGLRCTDGATRWNVFLPLTVRVWAPAVVLAAPLPAGSVLTAEHLALAEVDWAAEPASVFVDPARLVGRTLARPLPAGGAPRQSDLRARQWFAAGDTVRVVARGPGFSVGSDGTALSPGVEGQPSRVRTEGGRVVSGQPVGERRIEVGL
jgi:flagellar basal body P-ring formation protein FlgA